MKSVGLVGVVGLLMASPVLAADLIIDDTSPIYTAPSAYDWNGFYAGVNAGYGGGTFAHPFEIYEVKEDTIVDLLASGSADVTAGGFVGGLQAGYNAHFDNFVLGIEGDIQGSSIDGRVAINVDNASGDNFLAVDLGTSLDYFATLRGRAGVTWDRALLYATAGFAWGKTTTSGSLTAGEDTPQEFSIENDRSGYTVGAGIEYALTDNVTFKTEYLYTDLGSEELAAGNLSRELGGTISSDVAFHTVRAGLNFQF
jgi:outer membrane immunogenic protein